MEQAEQVKLGRILLEYIDKDEGRVARRPSPIRFVTTFVGIKRTANANCCSATIRSSLA